MIKTLIFVYNIDSSLLARILAYISLFSSSTRSGCRLRRITRNSFGMKDSWRKFLQFLPYKKEFLHRDEFRRKYPAFQEALLPAVFIADQDTFKLLAGPEEIGIWNDVSDMHKLLKEQLTYVH